MVSAVGFIAIFIGIMILKENTLDLQNQENRESILLEKYSSNSSWKWKYTCVFIFFVFFIVGSYLNFFTRKPVLLKRDLQDIPYNLVDWEGNNENLIYRSFMESGADNELFRRYVSVTGERIYLYVAYFSYQEQGKEIINYRTEDLEFGKKTWVLKTGNGKEIPIAKR